MSDPKPFLKKIVVGPLQRKNANGKWSEDASETVGTPEEGKFGLSVGPIERVPQDAEAAKEELKRKALRIMVFGREKAESMGDK